MQRILARVRNWLASSARAGLLPVFCALALVSQAHADGERHTFWAVKGHQNTVYLFGSVHVLKSDDHGLPEAAMRAYLAAKSLVMELDLNDATPEKLLPASLDGALLPDGQTLASVLGPAAYATLRAHLQTLGLDAGFFSQMQPWFVAVTLEQLEMSRLGFESDAGVEAQFTRRAQADHKPVIALETIAEQIGFFSHLSLDQQREFLLYCLEDADDSAKQINATVAAWQRGDITALERLLGEGFASFPVLYRTLTSDRNRKWLPRIEGLLHETQDYLVIVGALHLVGKDGVVALLERDGYQVQQQ